MMINSTEAGDSLGMQRKGNVRCWKPLPSNGIEAVTVDISLCVYVIELCSVFTFWIKKSNKSDRQTKTRL
jgi:hypothetical protein